MKGREDLTSGEMQQGLQASRVLWGCKVSCAHARAYICVPSFTYHCAGISTHISVCVPAFLCILPCVSICVRPHIHPVSVALVHASQEHMQEHILILEAGTHQGMDAAGRALAMPPLETSGPSCLLTPALPGPGVALWLIVMGSMARR